MNWTPAALDALAGELPLAQEAPALELRAQADGSQELNLDGIVGWDFTAGGVRRALRDAGSADLLVRINSYGGSVFEGFAIQNALSRHKGKVTVLVDAIAASAASVIAMAGAEIVMPANGFIMVHNAWTLAMGDYREMDKTRDLLQRLSAAIAAVYAARSGRDVAEMQAMMDAETWLGAEDAIAAGLATRMEGDAEALAAAVEGKAADLLAAYRHPPASLLSRLPAALAARRGTLSGTAIPAAAAAVLPPAAPAASTQPAQPVNPQEGPMATPNPAPGNQAPANPAPSAAAAATVAELRALAGRRPDVLNDAWVLDQVQAGVTLQAARDAAFEALAGTTPPRGPTAVVTRDERDTFRARAGGALAARMAGTAPSAEQREFYSLGLQGMLRECLAQAGVNGVHRLSNEQVLDRIRAEHTTSDFPIILRDAANRRLADRYDTYPQTWREWTREVDVTDFREISVGELGNFPKLKPKPESAPIRYGTVAEAGERYRLMTGASGVVLSREAIINDDMNAFGRMLDDAADVSYAWVADQAYGALTLNPNMGDGNPLFSAAHGNLITSADLPSGAALGMDEDNMAAVEQALVSQVSISGDSLPPPTRLNVLVGTTAQFNKAVKLSAATTTLVSGTQLENSAYVNRLNPVLEPRIAKLGGAFFVTAANRPTVEVAYLQGRRKPELTSMEDFDTKGMKYALVFDAAAAPVSWRGMVRHPGKA